jgi:hypothetical protein
VQGDRIDLQGIDANIKAAAPGDDAFTFLGTNVLFTGLAGELRAYWTAVGQVIEGDVDGNKIADFGIELVNFSHSAVLTGSDFFL